MNKYETHSGEIDTEILNLQTVDELKKTAEHQLEEARAKLEDLRTRLENMPSLDELNEEVRRERAEISRVQQPLRQKSQQLQRLTEEMKQVEEQIRVYQNNLNKLNDIKQARRNRVFQAFPNLKQISEIVHANRKRFRKPVWGPVACEVEMKTKTAAPALEQHVPNSVWKSFVVECKEDYDMLYKIVRQDMKLPINILTVKNGKLEDFERIYSERKYETLRRDHGVIGYLDE
jgi:chromosome segregation ATPase